MARFTSFCGVVSTLNLDRDPTVVSRALAQQSPCTRTYAPTQNTTSQAFDYVRKIPPELIKNHPMTRKTSSGSEASTASGTPGLRILIEPDTPQTGRWVGTYVRRPFLHPLEESNDWAPPKGHLPFLHPRTYYRDVAK